MKVLSHHLTNTFLKIALLTIAATLLFIACDQPRIFETKNTPMDDNSPLRGSNGDPVITMLITGGFAGVNRQLVIDSNGFVSFVDENPDGPRYTDYLTAAEYAEVQAKFLNSDFFHLRENYTEANVADAFYYDITFQSNGVSHRVVTDYLAAPSSLREIIDALNAIIDELTRHKLQLALTASNDTLQHGQTVKLTLTVKNLSAESLALHFRSGQIFDFYAFAQLSLALYPPTKVWNWAHDKAFTLALQDIILAEGEIRSYQIDWDGRNNAGQLLTGDFFIGAELVSVPGGDTRLMPLHIKE